MSRYDLHRKYLWSELDEIALTLDMKRLPNEDDAAFIERLRNRMKYPPGNTKQGLINGISIDLGLEPYRVEDKKHFYLRREPLNLDEDGELLPVNVRIAGSGQLQYYETIGAGTAGEGTIARNEGWKIPDIAIGWNALVDTRVGDDDPPSGFILWKESDGTYGRVLEFLGDAVPKTGERVTVEYYYTGDDGHVTKRADFSHPDDPLDWEFVGRKADTYDNTIQIEILETKDLQLNPSSLSRREIADLSDKLHGNTWNTFRWNQYQWGSHALQGSGSIDHLFDGVAPSGYDQYIGGVGDWRSLRAEGLDIKGDRWTPTITPGTYYLGNLPYYLFENKHTTVKPAGKLYHEVSGVAWGHSIAVSEIPTTMYDDFVSVPDVVLDSRIPPSGSVESSGWLVDSGSHLWVMNTKEGVMHSSSTPGIDFASLGAVIPVDSPDGVITHKSVPYTAGNESVSMGTRLRYTGGDGEGILVSLRYLPGTSTLVATAEAEKPHGTFTGIASQTVTGITSGTEYTAQIVADGPRIRMHVNNDPDDSPALSFMTDFNLHEKHIGLSPRLGGDAIFEENLLRSAWTTSIGYESFQGGQYTPLYQYPVDSDYEDQTPFEYEHVANLLSVSGIVTSTWAPSGQQFWTDYVNWKTTPPSGIPFEVPAGIHIGDGSTNRLLIKWEGIQASGVRSFLPEVDVNPTRSWTQTNKILVLDDELGTSGNIFLRHYDENPATPYRPFVLGGRVLNERGLPVVAHTVRLQWTNGNGFIVDRENVPLYTDETSGEIDIRQNTLSDGTFVYRFVTTSNYSQTPITFRVESDSLDIISPPVDVDFSAEPV